MQRVSTKQQHVYTCFSYSLAIVVVLTPGVPGPTSKFVAACPSPDGLARDGTQGGKRGSCYPAPGDALVVGVTSIRARERVSLFNSSFSRATLPLLA
jgi:hypothetical protein